MESISNCNLIIDIALIEKVVSRDGSLEIETVLDNRAHCILCFESVWDYRCSIEAACIDRFSKFLRKAVKSSSVLIVDNSEYIKYFETQASGTRPIDTLVEYIIYDKVDTIISVLSAKKPWIK